MMNRPLVDPFIPVHRRQSGGDRRMSDSIHIQHPDKMSQTKPVVIPDKKVSKPRRRFFGPKLQMAGIVIVAAIIGVLMTIPVAGQVIVGLYGVIVLIRKIPSKITFMIACGVLAFVVALLVAEPSRTLAMTFATYAFLLLVIGTITLAFETRRGEHGVARPGLHLHDE